MRTIAALAGVVALGIVLVGGSHAGETGSASRVKVSSGAAKPDASGKQVITITMIIDKGWHIYANPARNSIVASVQTEVKVLGRNPADVKIAYPPGKSHTDKQVPDQKYMVYEDRVDIPLQVQRTPNDGPVEVTLHFVACDDRKCLSPATVKMMFP